MADVPFELDRSMYVKQQVEQQQRDKEALEQKKLDAAREEREQVRNKSMRRGRRGNRYPYYESKYPFSCANT
jgi:hypothetical protein